MVYFTDPVGSARNGKECAENCFAKYEYAIKGFGCFAACGKKFDRSLEYPADEVVVIKNPTTNVREAGECIDNCYAKYETGMRAYGCVLACGTNSGRSL
jgi:hypothetical protein